MRRFELRAAGAARRVLGEGTFWGMPEHAAKRSTAVAVYSLITLTGLVFLYEVWLGTSAAAADAQSRFIASWGLVPREFLREFVSPGATSQVVWLTPLTAMFIHAGPLHLVGNGAMLWMFGRAIETRLGHIRFVGFYLLCGLTAGLIDVASQPASYLAAVGASGAVSGVFGAYLICHPHRRLQVRWPRLRIRAISIGLSWIVIQIISGLYASSAEEGGVAWLAHIGGFVVGMALIRWMPERRAGRSGLRS